MIGDNFDTPVMYQDLGKYSNGMLPTYGPNMFGMGMYGGTLGNTSYLGGVQIKPQLDTDKVQIMKKKNQEDKSILKKALIGIGVCFALGFIPGIRKNIKQSGGLWKYIKGLFSSSTAATTPAKVSKWQKFKGWCGNKWNSFKNIFKKKTTTPAPTPASGTAPTSGSAPAPAKTSKWQKFKGWCGNKWNSFKNIFKKKAPTQTSTPPSTPTTPGSTPTP